MLTYVRLAFTSAAMTESDMSRARRDWKIWHEVKKEKHVDCVGPATSQQNAKHVIRVIIARKCLYELLKITYFYRELFIVSKL